jgi:hypothetical protein
VLVKQLASIGELLEKEVKGIQVEFFEKLKVVTTLLEFQSFVVQIEVDRITKH